jgi:uncharacterized damage-inducible protein DinB
MEESEMSMNPEQAKAVADTMLADLESEIAATKRVIGAIPAGKESYAPDPKNMTAIDLAWHIARAEPFFLNSMCDGAFVRGDSARPADVRTAQDVIAWYDANLPPALARAKGLSAEKLAKDVDFFGVMKMPAASCLVFMVKHGAHHRGQLSAYLRPMGAKVPNIYGQSADNK